MAIMNTIMNKKNYLVLQAIIFSLLISKSSLAQTEMVRHKVAIFTPLHLDSAFNSEGNYRFGKNNFPKFLNPGLEFYEGVQYALDTLKKEMVPLEVFIYDIRSTKASLTQRLNSPELKDVQLIIAHGNSAEMKILADAAVKKNVPVINANLPNDGGASSNPFFVVLNPTLRTQCEGIYKYMQKFYSLNPIVVFKKKGQLEDRIKSYFEDLTKNTNGSPLDLKYVELTDSFSLKQLRDELDTIQETLCLAGSLDETFGKKLVNALAALKKEDYRATVLGMPTWDGINFNKPEFKGIDIIYSTPFYNSKTDRVSQQLSKNFNKKMGARPTDMVFRGYEVTFRFIRLLKQYGKDLASNLANKQTKVFSEFDIQPVLNKQSMTLDYFENKKLYFLKWFDGTLKSIL
jgi:ABC-type branched-subunit amino acid transport system substrate-binding protein